MGAEDYQQTKSLIYTNAFIELYYIAVMRLSLCLRAIHSMCNIISIKNWIQLKLNKLNECHCRDTE